MRALAAGLAAVALITACGGSGGGAGQPPGSIKVTMTDFHFDPSDITAPHGKVVFFLVNASSGGLQHDLAIRDSSSNRVATSELVSAGDSITFQVDNLAAGSYTLYCSQPGHEASGMSGKLTVT